MADQPPEPDYRTLSAVKEAMCRREPALVLVHKGDGRYSILIIPPREEDVPPAA